MIPRSVVFREIDGERYYQDGKWGTIQDRPHTVGEWLLILQGELDEAIRAWQKNIPEPHSALDEVRQIAAVAVACIEQHSCPSRQLDILAAQQEANDDGNEAV